MIPDESTYEVYDMSSRRGIGTPRRAVRRQLRRAGRDVHPARRDVADHRGRRGGGARERHAHRRPCRRGARGSLVDRAGDSGPEARCGGGRRIRGEAAEALAATPEAVAGDGPTPDGTSRPAKPVAERRPPQTSDREGERSTVATRLRPRSLARLVDRAARRRRPVPVPTDRRRSRHLPRGVGDDRPRPLAPSNSRSTTRFGRSPRSSVRSTTAPVRR